jgi:uroporphyrinogen decarboxylase
MKDLIKTTIKKDNFCVLHLHGDKPDFDLATQLPLVSAINWHDQQTTPNLEEARNKFSGALMGGLNTEVWSDLGSSEISEKIKEVYVNFKDNGLILSPGCVIPQQVNNEKIKAAVNSINHLKVH